jgi:hypothetical protein
MNLEKYLPKIGKAEDRLEKEWVWFLSELYQNVNTDLEAMNKRNVELMNTNWANMEWMIKNLSILENEFWLNAVITWLEWNRKMMEKEQEVTSRNII